MNTRRGFLRSISLAGAGLITQAFSNDALARELKPTEEIGIQLWTLRNLVQEDLSSTLKAVSNLGYTGIEAFGFDGNFFGQTPKAFKTLCDDVELKIYSTHTPITAENAAFYAESAAEAGLEYLILPSMMGRNETTTDDFKKTAREMNCIGKICRRFDIRFGYHNHEFEFKPIDGQLPYDILLMNTDPELVGFQMDIYWIIKAGFEPTEYFIKHPQRFRTWHIKDMGNDGESCIAGNGKIDFKSLMRRAETAGLHRMIVEQEHFSEGSPLFCAEHSLRYIQSNLF